MITIFAANNILEGGFICLLLAGFFCAHATTYGATPVRNCNGTAALEVLFNGKVTPFFNVTPQTKISEMNNAENFVCTGQVMPCANTDAHDTRNNPQVAPALTKITKEQYLEALAVVEQYHAEFEVRKSLSKSNGVTLRNMLYGHFMGYKLRNALGSGRFDLDMPLANVTGDMLKGIYGIGSTTIMRFEEHKQKFLEEAGEEIDSF